MGLTEVCIKRPVFSTVLTLLIVIIGLVCQWQLPVRKDPKIEKSMVTVKAEYRGASPQAVENQITKVLEEHFSTIAGVETMTSSSKNDECEITLEFESTRDPDAAASDVRDRLSMAKVYLPWGNPEPTISREDPDDQGGIVIAFTSDKISVDDLHDYVDRYVKSKFEVIPGVGKVVLTGGNVKKMKVFLDPQRLAVYGYTPADVLEALRNQHVQRPCGRLVSRDREYMLILDGEFYNAKEMDEVIIPSLNGKESIIKVKDIGHSELVPEDKRSGSWFNGRECVVLTITKQANANPVDLSSRVKKAMPEVEEFLPSGTKMVIAMDEARDISASMRNVYRAIFEATFLVIVVVFLFLWSFRATLIPIVTIPVSLLGTFALLALFGFSINTFTLLAMVLAVGLVVDDAIVVLENIHKHMEKGLDKMKASLVGSNEIFFSIVAMTLTLASAYIPIALTPGNLGRSFREFALTLSGAVIISGFVALTLSPMMCSRLLSRSRKEKATGYFKKLSDKQDEILKTIDKKYYDALTWTLDHKVIALSVGFVVSLIGILAVCYMPSESKPLEDQCSLSVSGEAPVGASFEFVKENAMRIDEVLKETPYAENRYINADPAKIEGGIFLKDWSERDLDTRQISAKMNPLLKEVPGISCRVSAGASSADKPVVRFVLQTNQDYEYLEKYGNAFLYHVKNQYPWFSAMLTTLVPRQQEYIIKIDRDKASSLGVTANDIANTIGYLIRGEKVGWVTRESKRDEMFIQVDQDQRRSIEDLSNIFVKSKLNTGSQKDEQRMVPLIDLVSFQENFSPNNLSHYNKMLAASAEGHLADGVSLSEAIEGLNKLKSTKLPSTIQLSFSGSTKTYLEESSLVIFIYMLALIFVYLILAAQFESFVDPFIIMFSVPFSITGALIVLWIIPDGTLNIYSKIGLVTLIGLITKHGILIVDFANRARAAGKNAFDAVREASYMRLRPILMTTFAMVIGNIPLALATGAGAAARRQIGWSIVGGMSIGTLFTLFIVPIVYFLFSRFRKVNTEFYK
ncbi:MAG: efflux RND transporter permease subunit [Alphaproteobacteria bacterium]|nr:efflux RND transporter permease subunit [Alphaproteobacteria bacterium]MBO7537578.1 efflux RND transporter permease subunit [Alphaproteobacteria bacterium]